LRNKILLVLPKSSSFSLSLVSLLFVDCFETVVETDVVSESFFLFFSEINPVGAA